MAIFPARGNTLGEYALMFGLLILIAVGAMKLLGGSIDKLFSHPSTTISSHPVQDMVSMKFGSGAATGIQVGASSSSAPGKNPSNQKLSDQLISDGVSGGTNATSVDGNTGTHAVIRTLGVAKKLEEMAEEETDPSLKEKLMAIAAQAYFLSGGEASLEYGQNPGSNPQLKALADLVEDPQNPSAGDPAMAQPSSIKHRRLRQNPRSI
ncbi:MAG: hypothetical protein K0Q50_499 [Vampirovibrio sp.]|jgi:Flp pilus assembly pilin Flp|nr:hypothetical protein [Vampirovibrio sp.]